MTPSAIERYKPMRVYMRAYLLKKIKSPLVLEQIQKPTAGESEILVRVEACGVCRTDLHILEGDLPPPKLPLILGHEIVGIVEALGKNSKRFQIGDRVGIPWLHSTCGQCEFCKDGKENLCDQVQFTGITHRVDLPNTRPVRRILLFHFLPIFLQNN